ncbi:unnamed protein product, partial [marine sediment metagenome]
MKTFYPVGLRPSSNFGDMLNLKKNYLNSHD